MYGEDGKIGADDSGVDRIDMFFVVCSQQHPAMRCFSVAWFWYFTSKDALFSMFLWSFRSTLNMPEKFSPPLFYSLPFEDMALAVLDSSPYLYASWTHPR